MCENNLQNKITKLIKRYGQNCICKKLPAFHPSFSNQVCSNVKSYNKVLRWLSSEKAGKYLHSKSGVEYLNHCTKSYPATTSAGLYPNILNIWPKLDF
jgi:hypothetical protein